jgi:acetyl-CoA carboxylase biotin carboxyl carrier protein
MRLDSYERLTLHTRVLDDGRVEVIAPKVGIWSRQPEENALLSGGAAAGTLRCRTERFVLVLPSEIQGRVVVPPHEDRIAAVEYGEMLFILADIGTIGERREASRSSSGSGRAGGDLPDGADAVRAPTDGVIYLRPTPEDPPFVVVGEVVRTGATLGLVEVMKTFNPILYGGQDLPEEAEVLEIRVEDGAEIHVGEILMTVKRG